MQTILGAGGAIGRELAKALKEYTRNIRLGSRKPYEVSPTDVLVSAGILMLDDVRIAVRDSTVVYVNVGLRYDTETWKKEWPVLIGNVLTACKEHICKLVFFDNIYM